MYGENPKYVDRYGDVPTEPHWAILKFSTIYIPGDERSRTNPGHGYPASHDPVVKYEAYTDEAEWIEAIRELENRDEHSYTAIHVTPAKVTTNIQVDVS